MHLIIELIFLHSPSLGSNSFLIIKAQHMEYLIEVGSDGDKVRTHDLCFDTILFYFFMPGNLYKEGPFGSTLVE
jgi:hypothetical protein